MAFKYVPYTFRDGEIIEPTRVLENMRVLATEFNGKLDRDNLPEDADSPHNWRFRLSRLPSDRPADGSR